MEGAAGALAVGCLGAWLALVWVAPMVAGADAPVPAVFRWILFGLIVATAGLVGDLAESLIKRDLGRKDSSDLVPGYGGVLDVLDSILYAAPVAWLCWACGLVG
jgi:phosphatidate cytidylyltransferase